MWMCVIVAFAQTLTANAPSKVMTGENFRLTYTVNTQNASDFRMGKVPDALEIITGPYTSQQSSFQMVNGHTSSSSSITYTGSDTCCLLPDAYCLMPRRCGVRRTAKCRPYRRV